MKVPAPMHVPKYITLSYEMVTAYARRFIESNYSVPLINLYGCTELGYLYVENDGKIVRCPELSRVEFLPFYPEKGIYYLIISSIKNEFMPFIRFKIGDLVKINIHDESDKISDNAEIEFFCGRENDVISNKHGKPITPGEIDYILASLDNKILIYQLQLKNENILFRYVSTDNSSLTGQDMSEITQRLNEIFEENINLQFKLERSIAPEISGKFSTLKKIS